MSSSHLYDFKTGYPDLSLVPREKLDQLMQQTLLRTDSLQYAGDLAGTTRARTQIARLVSELYSVAAAAENVIVTTGALHGIDITCRALTQPGDIVIVESPTFYFAVNILQMSRVSIVGVPLCADGIDLAVLEQTVKQHNGRVKLVYTIPAFHNPTGICYSVENRKALIALAQRYNFTILEDATYQPLYYGDAPPPIMRSFDTSGCVVTTASVSKLVMPALRVGWIYAVPEMIDRLKKFKGDGGTSMFNTEVVSAFIESGAFTDQVAAARRFYARKHDLMVSALDRVMPDWVEWDAPNGGYFIWMKLPEGVSASALVKAAEDRGIAVFAGSVSYADGQDDSHLRLCIAYMKDEEIEPGIVALSAVMRSFR